jgi:stage II sporulation protein D
VILTAQELRALIGFNQLRSTKFQVRELNHSYYFQGAGWGHGVGMCQWGAKAMAEDGKKFREILEFFYSS